MLIRKLNFLTQIIFFFDKEFLKIIINPKFYQHLFLALLIIILVLYEVNAYPNLTSKVLLRVYL